MVVALALAGGAALLLFLLQRALISGVDAAASARAGEVASLLRAEGVEGLDQDLAQNTRQSQLVQVVDQTGAVVASSSARAAHQPLSTLRPADGQVRRRELSRIQILDDDDDPYLVVTRGVAHEGVTYDVTVASSTQTQRDTVGTVLTYLLAGFPVLLLLVGGATWVLVGRALDPVERIRRRVHGIGGAQLADRVPVPATGDEIARLAVTMNEMLDRLQEAQATQRRFVADASHELRSPLATLTATLEVAAADSTGRAWDDLHEVMEAEAVRMGRLVEDLLLLAKVDDDGLRLHRSDVDLDDLLAGEGRRLNGSTDLDVQADIRPVRVAGDAAKLGQVLRNITDNAARAATARVALRLAEDGAEAVLIVDDDGPGVPTDDRERVFARFVRLDESRDRGSGGSGLGLAIVREVVRGHGGSVVIGDSPLGGARVEVRLPVSAVQPPSAASR